MFSPLQICGLIFFSKKLKKEREGNLQMIQVDHRKIQIKEIHWNLTIGHLPRVLRLTSPGQIYLLSRTQISYLFGVIFGSRNILILNSQLFLSHHQRTILMPQDSFRDTKNLLHFVINQRYRSLFDFVAVQSILSHKLSSVTTILSHKM